MRIFSTCLLVFSVLLQAGCGGGGGNGLFQTQIATETVAPQKLAIDVPAIFLSGDFLLNGGAFPAHPYEAGKLYLADAEGGLALLGSTPAGGYESCVIPGSYATTWKLIQGEVQVPRNAEGTVAAAQNVIASGALDVAVSALSVTSTLTLDGDPFPTIAYESARIVLRPVGGGAEVLLGKTHLANPPVMVLPGTYDVVYDHYEGTQIPLNIRTVLMPAVEIRADTHLAIDVESERSAIAVTLDGQPFSAHPYERAFLELAVPGSSGRVPLGHTNEGLPTVLLIRGTYDVLYRYQQGALIPLNRQATVATGLVFDGLLAHDVDIETAHIAPEFRLNGSPFPNSQYETGMFELQAKAGGDTVQLGVAHQQLNGPLMVIQGTYDAYYAHVQGTTVPRNKRARVKEDCVVAADATLTIDVTAHRIDPAFLLNGGPFPTVPSQRAAFDLRGETPGDEFPLGRSDIANQPVWAVEGSYDVLYRHVEGQNVPQNVERAVAQGVDVSSPFVDLVVDVPAREVAPTFTQNGVPYHTFIYNVALFNLRDPESGSESVLGLSYAETNTPKLMITGSYEVVYRYAEGDDIPRNARHALVPVEIVPAN